MPVGFGAMPILRRQCRRYSGGNAELRFARDAEKFWGNAKVSSASHALVDW